LPFGRDGVTSSKGPPAPPSRLQRSLSRNLDAVLLKALELRSNRRYRTAVDFMQDWTLARQGRKPAAAQNLRGRASARLRIFWCAALLVLTVGLIAFAASSRAAQGASNRSRVEAAPSPEPESLRDSRHGCTFCDSRKLEARLEQAHHDIEKLKKRLGDKEKEFEEERLARKNAENRLKNIEGSAIPWLSCWVPSFPTPPLPGTLNSAPGSVVLRSRK